jgi:hypothetical protein
VNGGRIAGTNTVQLAANDLTNRGVVETTDVAGLTQMLASRDLVNEGGTIAGGTVELAAGRDLINRAFRFDASANAQAGLNDASRFNAGQAQSRVSDTELGPAGRILAGNNATLAAGRDLRFAGGAVGQWGQCQSECGQRSGAGDGSEAYGGEQ